jgi:hypothetical protein
VQPELAVKFFERANNMAPGDTNIMDALADVHLQLDNQEEALALLLGLFYFICVYINMIHIYVYTDIYTDVCADIYTDNKSYIQRRIYINHKYIYLSILFDLSSSIVLLFQSIYLLPPKI